MKRPLTAIAITLAAAPLLFAAPPTTHLGAEWMVPSGGASPAFSLVDVATGAVRIAQMDASGVVTWPHHIASGVADVSDVAGGEALAITSASANRVVVMDPAAPLPFPKLLPGLDGVGPTGVAATGPLGALELTIASASNGIVIGKLETHENVLDTAALMAANAQPGRAFRRAQPLVAPGGASSLALVSLNAGGNFTQAWLVARDGASHVVDSDVILEGPYEFVTNIASVLHPTVPFVVAHVAGSDEAVLIAFSTPLTVSSTADDSPFLFPHPMASVMPVVGGGAGPIDDGVIATAADGSEARWIRVNAAGDALVDGGHAFPSDGLSVVAGAAVVPGVGVVQLNAPGPGMPATSYFAYQWDGSMWQMTDAGMLPDLADAAGSPASLLFYNANPFNDTNARLLGVQTVRDWTSLASYPDGLPASVVRETFTSASAGLVNSGTTTLTPPVGTAHVIPNQAEPSISITALGGLDRVFAPRLRVSPDSGSYDTAFQAAATFDSSRYNLRYRRDGGDWLPYQSPLPVAWTTTLQFMLEDKATGGNGPIVTRTYMLDPADLADVDSDGDGVPDYVELYFGLDPFGGADSDGDGFSDLDEILQGNNPADPLDFPTESLNLSPGSSIRVVATATDFDAREIANAEDMVARAAANGALLARAAVGGISPPLPDGGNRGALLASNSPPPFDDLVAVSTPLYFNNANTSDRSGREIIGFIPSDPPPMPDISFAPTSGMSLEDAATGWVAAAIAALGDTPLAFGRVVLTPATAATSVLLEELVHAAADSLRPAGDPMPPLENFTWFAARDVDAARARLTSDDLARLRSAGFSPRAALGVAEDAMPGLETMANAIYQRHAAVSASTPGMVLPIDALRTMLRGGSAPDGYAGAVSTAVLNDAIVAYQDGLAAAGAAFRPMATWVVEIPETPVAPGVYERVDDGISVALLRPTGARLLLDKGLGLRPGSQFTVVGFTDTPPSSGYPTMEVTGAALTFEPISSDRDDDGNLLDDEWEKFFFGETGQDPFSEPHGNGYSLLQYFFDGIDPRSGVLPGGPAVSLFPQLPIFTPAGGGGYTLDFVFPAAYQSQFTFIVERSFTLVAGSWVELPGIALTSLGGDELRAAIPPAAAPLGSAFYRIRVALAP
jgi:hypothetical protein